MNKAQCLIFFKILSWIDPTLSVCPSPHASPMNLRILQIVASLNRTRASVDVQLPQKWITLFPTVSVRGSKFRLSL